MKPGRASEAAARDPPRHGAPAGIARRHADRPLAARRQCALLEVGNLAKSFGLRKRGGLFGVAPTAAAAKVGGRRQLPHRARQLLRPGRRERLRQDDGQQDHPARRSRPTPASVVFDDGGTLVDLLTPRPARAGPLPAPHPVRLPGPVRLARPAHDGVRHRRRAAGRPRDRQRRLPSRDGERADAPRRPRPTVISAAIRTASPAASASASASPARWPCSRTC